MSVKGSRSRLRTAIEVDRRRIAQGERPVYRVLWAMGPDAVDVTVLELPIVHLFVPDQRQVLDGARLLIARTLAVDPQSFDVVAAQPD
jgi:hypothetical protein